MNICIKYKVCRMVKTMFLYFKMENKRYVNVTQSERRFHHLVYNINNLTNAETFN